MYSVVIFYTRRWPVHYGSQPSVWSADRVDKRTLDRLGNPLVVFGTVLAQNRTRAV